MRQRTMYIGLIGEDTVAQAFLNRMAGAHTKPDSSYQLTHVHGMPSKGQVTYTPFAEAITDSPHTDIVLITLSGVQGARLAKRAVEHGKHVICTQPLAVLLAGQGMFTSAYMNNVSVNVSAGVMGAFPLVSSVNAMQVSSFSFAPVCHANAVLERMNEQGESIQQALAAYDLDEQALNNELKEQFQRLALMRALCFGEWTNLHTSFSPVNFGAFSESDSRFGRKLNKGIQIVGTVSANDISLKPQLVMRTPQHDTVWYEHVSFATPFGKQNLTITALTQDMQVTGIINDIQSICAGSAVNRTLYKQLMQSATVKAEGLAPQLNTGAMQDFYVRLPKSAQGQLPTDGRVSVIHKEEGENTSAYMVRTPLTAYGLATALECEDAVIMPTSSSDSSKARV